MSGAKQARRTFVGVGEVLWDVLPEARHLGGAPFNFAFHAGQLGAEGLIVSRVGDDEDGRRIRRVMTELGMSDAYVQTDSEHRTGFVPVELDAQGKPTFTITEDVAYDYLQADETLLRLAAEADVVCFGTLAQRNARTREAIERFLAAAVDATLVYDINLRQHYYSRDVVESSLRQCQILKLNSDELPVLCRLLGVPEGSDLDRLGALCERHDLRLVCLTLGSAGCVVATPQEHVVSAGYVVDVADTVGSGDAFTAALVTGWLDGRPLATIADRANRVGAVVAARPGATPRVSETDIERLGASRSGRIPPLCVDGVFVEP